MSEAGRRTKNRARIRTGRQRSRWRAAWPAVVLVLMAIAVWSIAGEPITFQYVYDEVGRLIKVVDSQGNVVEYVYDEVGNLLEVKRFTVTGLAIFGFTPMQGPIGTMVTIQGQGFSPTPTDNVVEFNAAPAPVLSATEQQLEVTVPEGATTGPISVTVNAETAVTETDFVVTGEPVILSIDPGFALSDSTIADLQAAGHNLAGATFEFQPLFVPPAVIVDSAIITPDGKSASLQITVSADAQGTFSLVATTPAGSSALSPSAANALRVVDRGGDADQDGLSNEDEIALGTDIDNPDTDGDGILDGSEVAEGTDPLDPTDVPLFNANGVFSLFNDRSPAADQGMAHGRAVSVLSGRAPNADDGMAYGLAISVQNDAAPGAHEGVAFGPVISVRNDAAPGANEGMAYGAAVSVRNDAAPESAEGTAEGPIVSVENTPP